MDLNVRSINLGPDTTRCLARNAQETIDALVQHGHPEHAAAMAHSMSGLLRGDTGATIAALKHWGDLFSAANALLPTENYKALLGLSHAYCLVHEKGMAMCSEVAA